MSASSIALNRVRQFALSSMSAATDTQENIFRIFQNTSAKEKKDVEQLTLLFA